MTFSIIRIPLLSPIRSSQFSDLLFIICVNDFGRFGTPRPCTISSTPPRCSGCPSPSAPTSWVLVSPASTFLLLRYLPVNLYDLSDSCRVCSSEGSSLLESCSFLERKHLFLPNQIVNCKLLIVRRHWIRKWFVLVSSFIYIGIVS